jgi:hypothetical protein
MNTITLISTSMIKPEPNMVVDVKMAMIGSGCLSSMMAEPSNSVSVQQC